MCNNITKEVWCHVFPTRHEQDMKQTHKNLSNQDDRPASRAITFACRGFARPRARIGFSPKGIPVLLYVIMSFI
jgi:hypothetical protein